MEPSAWVQVLPALRNTKMSPGMVSKTVLRASTRGETLAIQLEISSMPDGLSRLSGARQAAPMGRESPHSR